MGESFKVFVTKDYLKFSAAHFIAYEGFREALHGHNYRVSVEIEGRLGADGYVVDFGVVKKIARELCGRLDERFLVPAQSDVLTVSETPDQLTVVSQSGTFSFPRQDCAVLPIVHSSAEELARYLAGELRRRLHDLGIERLTSIEVGVEETTGQAAFHRTDD
jgi:6-pyruvoyltetrahydropterin/6-carboxytetrahydropterin synthase